VSQAAQPKILPLPPPRAVHPAGRAPMSAPVPRHAPAPKGLPPPRVRADAPRPAPVQRKLAAPPMPRPQPAPKACQAKAPAVCRPVRPGCRPAPAVQRRAVTSSGLRAVIQRAEKQSPGDFFGEGGFFGGISGGESLGGLEDEVDEQELEQFRQQQEKSLSSKESYLALLEKQKAIYSQHYVTKSTLYKASEVTPEALAARGGWRREGGTEDLEAHLISLGSIWISTSSTFEGARHFQQFNATPYIYKLVGTFRGIDVNGFITELGSVEHMDRKANMEIAVEQDIPASDVQEYWTTAGGWKAF
jgi:hypothetical protein